jgi:hypothetical protein
LYSPLDVDELIFVTVGFVVSIIKFLLTDNDPVCPGDGRVNPASFPALSLIVPPFNPNEDVVL